MNIRLLTSLLLTALVALTACKDDEGSTIQLSTSTFESISASGATLTAEITTELSWTASAADTWVALSPTRGTGSQTLTLTVEENPDNTTRSTTVSISATGGGTQQISLTQAAGAVSIEEYQYKLPVIFHVLYSDASDNLQYVNSDDLTRILGEVNELYAGSSDSEDMNVTFQMAETDPEGNALAIPGVNYIRWTEQMGDYPVSYETFLTDSVYGYKDLLWDPNEYINIALFNFARESGSEGTTLGVTYTPFLAKGYELGGLQTINVTYATLESLEHPYCVAINSLFLYDDSPFEGDITVTIAHELGHYLGLHHVFSESDAGCEDTDYCTDTPSYDMEEYLNYIEALRRDYSRPFNMETLTLRWDCSGNQFVSTNLLDYDYSYANVFTSQQRARTRYVLQHAVLMPGPKVISGSRAAADGPLDLRGQMVVCGGNHRHTTTLQINK